MPNACDTSTRPQPVTIHSLCNTDIIKILFSGFVGEDFLSVLYLFSMYKLDFHYYSANIASRATLEKLHNNTYTETFFMQYL